MRLRRLVAAAEAATQSKHPAAGQLWQAIVDDYGDKAPVVAWVSLARGYPSEQRASAEVVLKRGLGAHPNSFDLLSAYAEIASLQQNWPEAIRRWKLVIAMAAPNAPLAAAFTRLATAYARHGDFSRAGTTAQAGMERYRTHAPIRLAYAEIASLQQNWPEAIRRYQAVIDTLGADASADSWLGLSGALRRSGNNRAAVAAMIRARRLFPSNVNVLLEAAEALTAAHDWPAALKQWRRVLRQASRMPEATSAKRLYGRFNISVIERIVNIKDYKQMIARYRRTAKPRRYAVYTSYTKDYDVLKLPQVVDPHFDYIVFTDEPVDGHGVFQVRPLAQAKFANDAPRASRYPKTHPHVLLRGYDAAIWVDTSFTITGDVMPLFNKFLASGRAIGSADHPTRRTLDEELQACINLKKEDPAVLKRQVAFYKSAGYATTDLSTNGVLMFNLKNPGLAPAMETWWQQICRFSRRDQLSFNYALDANQVTRFHMAKRPLDIYDHPLFVFTPHHTSYAVLQELYSQLGS